MTTFYSNANVNFNPLESSKNQFNIDRKGFLAGSEYKQTRNAQSIDNINKRIGQGNREIVRPSFMSPTIHARLPIDFDKLQALDIEKFGSKVQLGEKQLEKLTMVAVPDPQDIQWLKERARLVNVLRRAGMNNTQIKQELEVNKPLGREQRTINKPSKNIARESSLSTKKKLEEIKQEIDNGNAQSRAQQATLVGQIAVVLQNIDAVARMTSGELTLINQNLMRLKIPKDYRAVFAGHRVIGAGQYFNENKGIIAMFLMSNIPTDRTPNEPLLSWHTGHNQYEPAGLLQIYQMNAQNRYLDMETRTLDTVASLAVKGLAIPQAGAPIGIPAGMPGAPDFDLFA